MFDDRQTIVNKPGQAKSPAFFRNKIPIDHDFEGLYGEEDIADEDQTVKGMTA